MKRSLLHGFLVSIEGVDGSGKSSLCLTLSEKLSALFDVTLTKEPGATELGKEVRKILLHNNYTLDPKAEFLLFAADRAQHFSDVIIPALNNNHIVISDRMADSSLVYQGYVKKLPLEVLTKVNAFAMCNIKPDLTILIDIDQQTAQERTLQRTQTADSIETRTQEIASRIAGFQELFKNKNNSLVLDGKLCPQELLQRSYDHIVSLLPL